MVVTGARGTNDCAEVIAWPDNRRRLEPYITEHTPC